MRFVSLVLLLTPLALSAQQVPTRALQKADAEFQEPFDALFSLREIAPGKVMITDLGPKAVLLVDFAAGRQANVGRNGQGPGEYQFPGDVHPYRGDSLVVADRVGRRALLLTPSGTVGRTIPYPEGLSGMPELRGADRQGRLYFQGSPFGGAPGSGLDVSETVPDSVPLLRWDPATKRIDTLTKVKMPALKVNISGTSNARTVMMRGQPYAASDEWSVTPEGRVAVVRTGDYHVEWLGGAAPVRGAPVRYDRLRIADADKQTYLENMRTTRNRMTVRVGGPGPGDGSSQNNSPPAPAASEFDWPEYMPPFPTRSTFLSPEGELWVRRSVSARDSTPVYDLFNASGALSGRVTLPPGRRLAGLGKGVLYATRTDEDGLQWLERYLR